jgi:hypothetical protein
MTAGRRLYIPVTPRRLSTATADCHCRLRPPTVTVDCDCRLTTADRRLSEKRFDADVETADNGARPDAYERRVLAPLVPPTESGTWRSRGERNPGIARRPFESAGSVTANI